MLKRGFKAVGGFFHYLTVRFQLKNATKVAIAASVGWILGTKFSQLTHHPQNLVSGLWCVLTAILVLQSNIGGTYRAAWNRFLGVLIGSLIGGVFTDYLGSDPLSLGLGVLATVILCAFFNLEESYRIACASTTVITVLWGLYPEVNPWVFSFFRFIDSCIGILLAMIIAHTFWPFHANYALRDKTADAVRKFNRLLRMIFQLKQTQSAHRTTYDKLLLDVITLLHDTRTTLTEFKAEMLTKAESYDQWTALINDLDLLYEATASLGNVFDTSTKKLFDERLDSQLNLALEKLHIGLEEMANLLETGVTIAPFPDLTSASLDLKEEITHYRTSHPTRNFSLDEVEKFFVFFYSLKTILDLLSRMHSRMDMLNSNNGFQASTTV